MIFDDWIMCLALNVAEIVIFELSCSLRDKLLVTELFWGMSPHEKRILENLHVEKITSHHCGYCIHSNSGVIFFHLSVYDDGRDTGECNSGALNLDVLHALRICLVKRC